MGKYNIRNLKELQARKALLKAEGRHLERNIKREFLVITNRFNIKNLLTRGLFKPKLAKIAESKNITGNLLSMAIPYVVNKTVLRKAGWFKKLVAGIVMNKLGKKINI